MILIGKRTIVAFGSAHPPSRKPLAAWEQVMKQTDFNSFNELKQTFPSADYVYHKYTIFNIGGNKYRLISEIDYLSNVVNVKRIFTHSEYSMKKNEDSLRRNQV